MIAEGTDWGTICSGNKEIGYITSKIVRVEKGNFTDLACGLERVRIIREDPSTGLASNGESAIPQATRILNIGPYKIKLEIPWRCKPWGIKRVLLDEVDGIKQGAAFRFIQGLDAGLTDRLGP